MGRENSLSATQHWTNLETVLLSSTDKQTIHDCW